MSGQTQSDGKKAKKKRAPKERLNLRPSMDWGLRAHDFVLGFIQFGV